MRWCCYCGSCVDEPHRCEEFCKRTARDPLTTAFREEQSTEHGEAKQLHKGYALPTSGFVGGWRSGKRRAAE